MIIRFTSLIKKFWPIMIVAVIAIYFLLILPSISNTTLSKKAQKSTVRKGTLSHTLTLSGSVGANEKTILRFQTSGRLSWVGVKEGDHVTAGQAVASLDQRDVYKALQKKLISYMDTRDSFTQTKEDYQNEIIDDELKRILDKNQRSLDTSVLDVELAHLSLEYATLISPLAGIVTSVSAPTAGVNVTPAQSEITVINPDSLYLSINADQSEVIELYEGMPATLQFDAFPEHTASGSVTAISFTPKSGESSTVYEVKIAIPKSVDTHVYRIGMTADAIFTLKEKKDALSVPSSAIKTVNGKPTVQVVLPNGKTETKQVTLGEEYDTKREVLGGLNDGDTILN